MVEDRTEDLHEAALCGAMHYLRLARDAIETVNTEAVKMAKHEITSAMGRVSRARNRYRRQQKSEAHVQHR